MRLKITTKPESSKFYEELTVDNIYNVLIEGSILQYSYLGYTDEEITKLEKRFETINMDKKSVCRLEIEGSIENVEFI